MSDVHPAPVARWRRALLVLVTALLVARPLLPGEDAALLSPLSDSSGLVLTFLWLVALALWAVGALFPGSPAWRGGSVEAGLLVVVLVQFLSAGLAAHYRHPAWLVAWEWTAMVVALFLVHQLAPDQRLVLAVVLATGTSVAVYGIYQSQVEFPLLRERLGAWDHQLAQHARNLAMGESAPMREQLQERIRHGHAFATFGHPNSFAGYLVLLLPLVVGAALTSGQRGAGVRAALAGIVVVFAGALWLSHSRGGMLAAAVVAGCLLAGWRRRWLARHWWWAVLGAALLLVAGGLVYHLGLPGASLGKQPEAIRGRLEYWTATWAMIADHPWLGVGPGNFARHYPSYMPIVPRAWETIRDPHQFALELWATSGVFGMAALLFALGAFAARSVRFVFASRGNSAGTPEDGPESPVALFYLGGGLGLLLAAVLTDGLDPLATGLRVLVWFAAFWLFQAVLVRGDWMVVACLAGVMGLLLHLLVAGGIGSPAVAQPLWTVLGIGLAGLPTRRTKDQGPRTKTEAVVGLVSSFVLRPSSFVLAGVYLAVALHPSITSRGHLARADRLKKSSGLSAEKQIGEHLDAACAAAPRDARPLTELALWQWQRGEGRSWRERCSRALATLEAAQRLDPRNEQLASYHFEADLQMARAVEAERAKLLSAQDGTPEKAPSPQALAALEREREVYLDRARERLEALLHLDPTAQARAHFQMAATLTALNDPRARAHARTAWQAHQEARSPVYRLAPAQLQQVEQWRGP